jgi:SAM-dependent methyltransferase
MATETSVDREKARAFVRRMVGFVDGMAAMMMIEAGAQVGLFEAMAAMPPATSNAIAERAGLHERYVREWLGAMVLARVVEYDPAAATYHLPPEHAASLTGDGPRNLGRMSAYAPTLYKVLPQVVAAFKQGGGVPYAAYQPEFSDWMDHLGRGRHDTRLLSVHLPAVAGLVERLHAGARVADIGCGTGHALNLMARAFPASSFTGFDISHLAIERARAEAETMGLANARFEILDVATLPAEPKYDVITAFDAIHDQVAPAAVLRRVCEALTPDGVFVMVDVRASSNLEDNLNIPAGTLIYTVSTMHCMTVSLAHGGTGLGAAWGYQRAEQMLHEAGFSSVRVLEVDDPQNLVYEARRS